MPDWVNNEITVTAEPDQIEKFINTVENSEENLLFDFHQIIPMPSSAKTASQKFGWYESNWGTTSNAAMVELERYTYQACYKFNTAYSAPEPIARKLRLDFPDLEIRWKCTLEAADLICRI